MLFREKRLEDVLKNKKKKNAVALCPVHTPIAIIMYTLLPYRKRYCFVKKERPPKIKNLLEKD